MLETLFEFNNFKEYREHYGKLIETSPWLLRDLDLKERSQLEHNHPLLKELYDLGIKRNVNKSYEEALSWCDSLTLFYRLIDHKMLDENIMASCHIIAEYRMPYSNKRIDYLLCLDKKYLVIEFSLCRSHQKDSLRYGQELDQAIEYKALLSNIVGRDYDIAVFSYLIYPEVDAYNRALEGHLLKNERGIQKLSEFINYYFNHEKEEAYHHLEDIQASRW